MHGSSPRALAGRDNVLAAVLDSLRRTGGHGAVVAAETGLGKTAVAVAAAHALEKEAPVYRVYSSPALKSVPYGALAALLPDLEPEQTDNPLAVMRALMARIFPGTGAEHSAGSEERAPLLVVDDAHEMDAPSLELLAQLLDAGRIRLLILTRAFADVSAVLPHMWDGQLSRHRLSPLTEAEVQQLCEQELQGQVSATASIELARLTGGNPMYLLALIEESVRSGFLTQRHGIWSLSEDGFPVAGRLGDLVKSQLRDLDKAERTALETICLAEPLPLAAAFHLGMHNSMDTLADRLLVKVTHESGVEALRPVHPLHGEVIRSMVPAARSARLLAQLRGLLPDVCVGPEGLLRWVAWSMELGADVPHEVLLRAAEEANNRANPRLALRAAAAAAAGPLRVPARIQEARALLQLGDAEGAAAAAEGTVEEAPDLLSLKQAMMLALQLAMLRDEDEDWSATLADRWLHAVGALPGTQNPETARWARCGAQMLLLLGKVRNGEYADAELELSGVLRRARESGEDEAVLFAEALMTEVLVATGRSKTALEHSRAALALLRPETSGAMLFCPFVLHRHLSVLLWLGDWDELRRCAASADSPVQQTLLHSGGVADFALGICHTRSGSLEGAIRNYSAAVEAAEAKDPEGLLGLSLALGSFAAGALGQRELAERMFHGAQHLRPRGPRQYRLMAAGILHAGTALRNSDDAALQRLRDAADEARDRNFAAVEFTLRHLSFRVGDFSEAERLLKITEGFEGPQAPVLNKVARAVIDQDAAALTALAVDPSLQPELDQMLSRQCLLEALRVARKGSDRTLLNRIQRLVGRQGTGGGVAPMPELTRRERDVAALVAAGHRNLEIARLLNLSVRTVEGHIYRTYEKLGISRREELKARFSSAENQQRDQGRPTPAE